MMEEIIKPYKNVTLHLCSELVAQYAKKTGANVLLRGIRNTNDFAYEFDLSLMNHMLNPDIETLFIPTEQRYVIVKSSSKRARAISRRYFVDGAADRRSGSERKIPGSRKGALLLRLLQKAWHKSVD